MIILCMYGLFFDHLKTNALKIQFLHSCRLSTHRVKPRYRYEAAFLRHTKSHLVRRQAWVKTFQISSPSDEDLKPLLHIEVSEQPLNKEGIVFTSILSPTRRRRIGSAMSLTYLRLSTLLLPVASAERCCRQTNLWHREFSFHLPLDLRDIRARVHKDYLTSWNFVCAFKRGQRWETRVQRGALRSPSIFAKRGSLDTKKLFVFHANDARLMVSVTSVTLNDADMWSLVDQHIASDDPRKRRGASSCMVGG